MQKFENQIVSRYQCPVQLGPIEWENSIRYTQNVSLQDLEFVNCEFLGEGLTTYGAPINRSSAQRIRVKNCKLNSFFGHGAIFDDMEIDGLRTSNAPVILSGCVLRHVVLKGKCGRFLFNRTRSHDDKQLNADFAAANAAFYANVDWALDISTVKLSGLEIRGSIPTRLIRRNPDEHFIMTRTTALAMTGKTTNRLRRSTFLFRFFWILVPTTIFFVAAKQSKKFKEQIEYFHRLKAAGLVT